MNIDQIKELTKQAYDKTALKYYNHFKNEISQKEYDRLLLEKFSGMLNKGSLICDAGCGPCGNIGMYMVDKGHKITGIDISPKCIEIASSCYPQIEFEVMDILKTDFKDEQFDALISFYSIIYTPKKYVDKIFKEFNRILKRNGKLLIVVKKGTNEGVIDDEWYEGNKVYFTYFKENEIKDYFARNNFRIDYFDVRKPYDFEIKVDRIYSIGTKMN